MGKSPKFLPLIGRFGMTLGEPKMNRSGAAALLATVSRIKSKFFSTPIAPALRPTTTAFSSALWLFGSEIRFDQVSTAALKK